MRINWIDINQKTPDLGDTIKFKGTMYSGIGKVTLISDDRVEVTFKHKRTYSPEPCEFRTDITHWSPELHMQHTYTPKGEKCIPMEPVKNTKHSKKS